MCSSFAPSCGGRERASEQSSLREHARSASHVASVELRLTLQRESHRTTQVSPDVDGLDEHGRCH